MVSKHTTWTFWFFITTVVISACVACFGCNRPQYRDAPASPAPPVRNVCPNGQCPPPADVPRSLRTHNYIRSRQGSCFYAAFADCLVSQDSVAVIASWKARYGAGATVHNVAAAARASGIQVEFTTSGDTAFLDRCSQHRRAAAIVYDEPTSRGYGGHAITFCGFVGNEAVLINNNYPAKDWRVPKATFLATWRRAGGDAIAAVGQPTIPVLW